ncbi:hypothetical protein [Sphingobium yanoikuyae]|uniref:Uncharacterized protein n=1 Tax=Sphingobium yanoikuyae TaxID=13690 RepID=A0A291N1H1_SPHYA|nr:hypothetical protein [Sphingobium yanoikuyae]ATI81010.1 hypothetical protein A6768_14175 [Sphingobium yanoikuyae]
MIDPQELFDRVKQLWPAEVPILANEENDIYWSLEKRLGDDDWMQIAAWSSIRLSKNMQRQLSLKANKPF